MSDNFSAFVQLQLL